MPFDPDEFLKEVPPIQEVKSSFDPDEFLKEELPVKQEQGVGFFDRQTVNMLKGEPEMQLKALKSEGYIVERGSGDTIKVRRPEDKEWKVVNPEGLSSIGDAIQDTIEALPEIGMGVASISPVGTAAGVATTAAKAAASTAPAQAVTAALKTFISEFPVIGGAVKGATAAKKAFEAAKKAKKASSIASRLKDLN